MANDINKNPLIDQLGIDQKLSKEAEKRNTLGQEEFLKLLVAQVKNQDPLKPQENGEFLGQMAQFSQVQGQQDMQKSIDNLSNSMMSNQALQASSLVGRFVLIPSDKGFLPEGQGERFYGALEVPETATNVQIDIRDKSGSIVKTFRMGNQPEGLTRFSWDGVGDNKQPMPPGDYTVSASALINDTSEALKTNIVAPVDSVTLGRQGEGMKLNIAGVGAMRMDQVKEIL